MIRDCRPIVRREPCLVDGKYGVDPAHWPERRSHGAGYGLLEMLPLCREHHRLLDEGSGPWEDIIERLGKAYHVRQEKVYRNSGLYMGPTDRIEAVRRGR